MGNDEDISDSKRHLELAKEAARRGEPVEMIESLFASGFLDGLKRRLQKQWGQRLPASELDDCVAAAVDSAYDAVRAGRSVRELGAWLWKAANNQAVDRWGKDFSLRAGQEPDEGAALDPTGETNAERLAREELHEHRRNEAIRLARSLIPRIGTGRVVDVMELVIDAAADGIPDLPASSIADSLGIDVNSARALLSRGFARLSKLAREEGFELPDSLPDPALDELED